MSSLGKFIKQATRMQRQIEVVQEQLAARTIESTSGGGAVKVVARCDGTLASIHIDPQAINPADAQLLEDLVLTAVNSALSQAKEIASAEMAKVTGGFNMPPGWPDVPAGAKPVLAERGAPQTLKIYGMNNGLLLLPRASL